MDDLTLEEIRAQFDLFGAPRALRPLSVYQYDSSSSMNVSKQDYSHSNQSLKNSNNCSSTSQLTCVFFTASVLCGKVVAANQWQ